MIKIGLENEIEQSSCLYSQILVEVLLAKQLEIFTKIQRIKFRQSEIITNPFASTNQDKIRPDINYSLFFSFDKLDYFINPSNYTMKENSIKICDIKNINNSKDILDKLIELDEKIRNSFVSRESPAEVFNLMISKRMCFLMLSIKDLYYLLDPYMILSILDDATKLNTVKEMMEFSYLNQCIVNLMDAIISLVELERIEPNDKIYNSIISGVFLSDVVPFNLIEIPSENIENVYTIFEKSHHTSDDVLIKFNNKILEINENIYQLDDDYISLVKNRLTEINERIEKEKIKLKKEEYESKTFFRKIKDFILKKNVK